MRPADVPAGSTARAVMEAAASAALARYREAIDLGTRRVDAERAYRDHILKAWDRTQPWAAEEARKAQEAASAAAADPLAPWHRGQVRAADLDAALAKVRAHA